MFGQDYKPAISFPEPPDLPKIDRTNMALLVIEAEKCPLILSRILEIVREHDVLPFTIATRRDSRLQNIEIELTALPQRASLAILQDLRRLSNVRLARLLLPAEQASLPVTAKA